MTTDKDIQQALSVLSSIGNGYSPDQRSFNFSGYGDKYKVNYADILKQHPVNYSFTPSPSSKKKKKSSSGINLWDVLSGTLGQPSGFMTTMLSNVIDDSKHIKDKDVPLWKKIMELSPTGIMGKAAAQGIKGGAKEQWKDWTDGKLSWGDVPSFGFLHGMDKSWDRGSDILEKAGVKNRWGKVGGGIGIDIALDPLTYLTGGLSAASKLGKAAEAAKIAELGKSIGLTGKFKKADDFIEAATDAMKSSMVRKNPNISERIIDKTVAKKVDELAQQIKTARNTTYNSHINDWGFSVPFTNKFAKAGTYGAKNLLHRTEATVPQTLVKELLGKAALGNDTGHLLEEAVKARYGVDDMGQLSKTMFDDLHKFVEPIIKQKGTKGLPDVLTSSKVVEKAMSQEDFTRLMDKFKSDNLPWKDVQKQLDQILTQTAHDPALRSSFGSHLAKMVEDYWKKAPTKNFNKVANARKAESMNWASKFLKESDTYKTVENKVTDVFKHGNPEANAMRDSRVFNQQFGKMLDNTYNEMGNFKTRFEHGLDKKNIFDARTLATGDKFVNSMGDHISDAHSQRIGETARYARSMDDIKKFVDKIPEGDRNQVMKEAIYVLENHAPTSLGKNWVPSQQVQQLADKLRPVIDRIGQQETSGGILDQLRNNYFPHVVNHEDGAMEKIQDFMKRNPELSGKSSKSSFNKERTSFQTIAERDNYIEKLEKAIQKETDSATIESLKKQRDRVANMFDTDVVSALQRRIKTGVRAKAMKEMQGKLSKYGMMKTIEKGSKESPPTGLKKLDPDEAKKLGLGEGTHYIHEDVLKGMKRVDEIFTSEGMNKFTRHISAIADIWRPLVTYYKPSHYFNNIIGNAINNLAAGVKVSDYRAAGKLITGYRKGKLTEAQMKIMESAYKHNVISGGFLYDSHQTFDHANPSTLDKIAGAIGNNKTIKEVRRHMGEKPDDVSRLANYLNGINKWGNTERAANQVRTYLFNYNELTNADRTMRVIVPFWNWTKRNVPLQMKTLLENPKFAMNIERFKQVFNQDKEGAEWQKDTGIKVPNTNYYTSLPSPTNDLEMLTSLRPWLGSMTPAAKIPLELTTNQKLYSGSPISYGSDGVQPSDLLQYLSSNLGLGGNAYDAFSGKRGPAESIINLFKNVSQVQN